MRASASLRHRLVAQPTAVAVEQEPPSLARALELLGLFVVLPLLLRWSPPAIPRLAVLALVTAGCLALLLRDPTFDWRRELSLGPLAGSLRTIALRTLVVAAAVVGLVAVLRPDAPLSWPPGAALAGLAAYPFVSAWPQEVVYRVFFFRRYEALLGRTGLVAANAAAFGALHLVYPNLVAPLLSVPVGLLLALTYRRTRTLGPVWLEHAFYGLVLFGLGLGDFFR